MGRNPHLAEGDIELTEGAAVEAAGGDDFITGLQQR